MRNQFDDFIEWFMVWDYEISFFFIGYFFACFFEDVSAGNGTEAFFDVLLVAANIYFLKRDHFNE